MVIKPTEKGKFYPLINKKGNYFFGVYVGRFRLKTQDHQCYRCGYSWKDEVENE